MKNFSLLALAAVAVLSSVSAHADEADGSQHGIRFTSTRSVAEVRTEALNPVQISNGGTGFIGLTGANLKRDAIVMQGAQSARMGQTSRGEIGLM